MIHRLEARLLALLGPERVRFVKFCVVGGTGVVTNMAVFLAVFAALPSVDEALRFNIAQGSGFVVSCAGNFLLNDLWTWGDREKRGRTHFWQRLGTYYVVSLGGYAVQAGTGNVLLAADLAAPWVANLAGIALGTVFNFVLNNLLTFRKPRSG